MNYFRTKAFLVVGFGFFFLNVLYSQDQRIADSLIKIFNSTNPNDSARLSLLSDISFNITDPDSALLYSDKLFKLAASKSDYLSMCKGCYFMGYALRQKGRPGDALRLFFLSAKYAEKSNYRKGLGIAYSAIGDAYSSSRNNQNSILYYKKAIQIFGEIGDSMALASTLLNLGTNYFNFNNNDSALIYFNESQKIFLNLNYEVGLAYCFGNIGFVETKQDKFHSAEDHILRAVKILLKYDDNYSIAAYYSNLANSYKRQGKYGNANGFAQKALQISLEGGFKAQIRDAYEQLSEISLATGNYKAAYDYQSKYYTYRDSINNNETIRKMADQRTEFEVAQKQAEVDYLMKKRAAQRIIVSILAIALILFATLLLFLYRSYKKNMELTRILQDQKEELMAQQEQLAELNSTKDRFFSIVSHDLRGPIGAFSNYPSLINQYVEMNQIEEIDLLSKLMDGAIKNISFLLDNLLEWAVNQQGTFPYRPEKLLLNHVMEEIYTIFSHSAENKGIELTEDINQEINVYADKNSLMTIFRNLINNSIKFTNKGGKIIFSAYSSKQFAVVKVKDSGVGIPETKLKNLFLLSEEKSTWGTDREKGLGLGLTLVYDFVNLNNGQIDVESIEGAGTVFTIRLPIYKENSDNQPS